MSIHRRSVLSSFLLLTLVGGLFAANAAESPAIATAKQSKPAQYRVKVFFPKPTQSNNNLSYVEPVWRTTFSQGVARFAIEQLIAGPQAAERQKGFENAIKLRGNSNCGADFSLSVTNGVARLKFCRDVVSAGIGDDIRTGSSLEATLKQFPTVKKVILLNKSGNCLGDMSGENFCLRK